MAKNMALGSRPKEEYQRKLVGIVTIVTGKEMARLTLTEDGKTFSNGTDTLKVLLKDLPKHPRIAPDDKSGKEYRVRMNQDGDEVEAITPVRGHFQAKLVDLGPRPEKDADPAPFEKVFDEGGPKESRHFEFFAVYEITSGAFKGVQLPAYWMHYKFEEDPDNEGMTRFAGNFENKKASRLFQLRDWGNAHHLWEKEIPWDEDEGNILPTLLERALENDVEVEVNLAGGYILKEGGVLPTDGYNEEQFGGADDVDVDEAYPPVEEKKSKTNGKKAPEPKKVAPAKPAKKLPKKSSNDDDDDL